jgi:hypothetical protein
VVKKIIHHKGTQSKNEVTQRANGSELVNNGNKK